MKVLAITQARVGSSRLPGKVLLPIGKETLLGIHLNRLKKAKSLSAILVATTHEDQSDEIVNIAKEKEVLSYKGDTNDVLDRFYQAAKLYEPEYLVRVTSDCPLIDPQLIDAVVEAAVNGDYDYFSNTLTEDFPDGQDIEVVKMSVLTQAWKSASKPSEREHVTPYIRTNSNFNGGSLFKAGDYSSPVNYNQVRMTVDEQADYEVIFWLIGKLGDDKGWQEYADYMLANPERLANSAILRNEGYLNALKQDKQS